MQPSRRPDDGRFGQNPNRLFKHHQYQVILKPSPDEVQQLYLDSLEACGINPRQHDIRFEEDNWESPTLGAWGIGWQVLLDGLEITQFTYFQQVGGIDLDADLLRDHLRARAHRDVPAAGRQRVRPRVGRRREVRARCGCRRRSSSRSTRSARWTCRPAEFAALHRDLFDKNFGFAETAARVGADLAGARALPEVLAPVQHPRLERQHRRHRAHGLHPARAAAGRAASPGPTSDERPTRPRRPRERSRWIASC